MDVPGSTTSIFAFQTNESLAGLASRCASMSGAEFAAKHPDPVLLTAMPSDPSAASLSIVIPVRKKSVPGDQGIVATKTRIVVSEVALAPSRVFVGRGPECDIMLAPKSISRRHAVLEVRGGAWHVVDLGSTNGTKVNGQPIAAKTYVPLQPTPASLQFGSDVELTFLLPSDLFAYLARFAQQVSETSQHKLPAQKPKNSEATPPENSFVARIDEAPPSKPKMSREQIAQAETGPFQRPDMTWHDETDERPAPPAKPQPAPRAPSFAPAPSSAQEQAISDPTPKLAAAIKAIAALDSLIMTVSIVLKADGHSVTIYSSSKSAERVTDSVADQLVRYEPLMKSVIVTLSIGDGQPVEIYAD